MFLKFRVIDCEYIVEISRGFVKASAHSFYFAAIFKIIFFSLHAPITSDECHAWFHLNAASPAVSNTEQGNITKKIVHDKIRSTNTARPPVYNHSATTRLIWMKELNVHEMYIYTIYE